MKKCIHCHETFDLLYFGNDGQDTHCGFCEIRLQKSKQSVTELDDDELTEVGLRIKRRKKFRQEVEKILIKSQGK